MTKMAALLGAMFLLTLWPAASHAADQGEQAFARDSSLMAFVRIRNLESVDARISKFLQGIYSGTPSAQPLKDALGRRTHNAKLATVQPASWAEALLFSLPLEADNDWVYVMRGLGEDAYAGAMLDSGTVRREMKEDGVIRLRATEGENFLTFFAAVTGPDILVIGRNRSAVDKARKLYAFAAENGLFAGYAADLAFALHLNRYLLTAPRVLSETTEALRRDLVRDLAGPQAKQDNPLDLGLAKSLAGLTDVIREVAVVETTVEFREDALALNARLSARYGGGIHYALSNLKPVEAASQAERGLPPAATALARGRIWPEMYNQMLDGIGRFVQAALGRDLPAPMLAETKRFLTLLQEAGPQDYAAGLIDSPEARRGAGPAQVTVTRWSNPQKLGALWESGVKIIREGPLSEALAERGMRMQAETEAVSASGWQATRAEVAVRSTYFTLPGGLGKPQHYLAATQGEYLVLVLAAGTVSAEEYATAEPWLLEVLAQTLQRLPKTDATATPAAAATTEPAQPGRTAGLTLPQAQPGEILSLSANPLRLVQAAVHAQSVWPDPAEPNRLPVPWGQYYAEFMRFPATAAPGLLRIAGRAEGLELELLLPRAAITELAASLLDFSAPVVRD